jgi:hypothetical protein
MEQSQHTAQQVRGQLARVLPFLRRNADVSATTVVGVVTMADAMVLTDSASVARYGSLDERVAYLASELERIDTDLRSLRTDVDAKDAAQQAALHALKDDLGRRYAEIDRRIDEAKTEETKINASALPLIGFGIVLSSGAADIARLPVWANVIVLVALLAISASAVWQIRRKALVARQVS